MSRILFTVAVLALAACRATTLGNEETGMSVRKALAKNAERKGKPVALDAEDSQRTMQMQHMPLDKEQSKQAVNLLK